MINVFKKRGVNVKVVATNSTIEAVLSKASKTVYIPTAKSYIPKDTKLPKKGDSLDETNAELPDSKTSDSGGVKKGDGGGAKKGKDDENWSNGDGGKKGEASHKQKKARSKRSALPPSLPVAA